MSNGPLRRPAVIEGVQAVGGATMQESKKSRRVLGVIGE